MFHLPKYAVLKPLDQGVKWKKQMLHFNQEEWTSILTIANQLGLSDLSSVIKACLKISEGYFEWRKDRMKEFEKLGRSIDVQPHEVNKMFKKQKDRE